MASTAVLLVEDSAEDVALIVSALEKVLPAEHIRICGTGQQALDYLLGEEDRPPRPDAGPASALPRMVLLDLNLPDIGGLEILRRLRTRAATRLLPVIVLSASIEQADVRAATRAGANSYVRKSLDHARLAEAVQLTARYWLELNIGPPAPPHSTSA